jgi:hypothetical protein
MNETGNEGTGYTTLEEVRASLFPPWAMILKDYPWVYN